MENHLATTQVLLQARAEKVATLEGQLQDALRLRNGQCIRGNPTADGGVDPIGGLSFSATKLQQQAGSECYSVPT